MLYVFESLAWPREHYYPHIMLQTRNLAGELRADRRRRCAGIDPFSLSATQNRNRVRPALAPRTKGHLMKSLSIFALSAALAFLALGGPGAYAQQEIDPDHFDSPNTEPVPQPRTADSEVRVIRYHGTFSLPYHVRGEAYLAMNRGSDAAAEFQKIIDHRGVVLNGPIGALAHLGLARANVLQGDNDKAALLTTTSSHSGKTPTPTSPS